MQEGKKCSNCLFADYHDFYSRNSILISQNKTELSKMKTNQKLSRKNNIIFGYEKECSMNNNNCKMKTDNETFFEYQPKKNLHPKDKFFSHNFHSNKEKTYLLEYWISTHTQIFSHIKFLLFP